MRRLFLLFALFSIALFSTVQAQPLQPVNLLIYNVWVRPTAAAPAEGATPEPPLPGTVTSAYMTIENTGLIDVRLTAIDDNFAELSMIHETTIDDAGVARMRMVGALDIPAGATVQLAPAGYHAMLMDVTRDLYPDAAEKLVLTFADSDGITFTIPVGALVTDFPLEESTLIVANAGASATEDGISLSVVLGNRSEQPETLVSVESAYGETMLVDRFSGESLPFETVEVAASNIMSPETGWILMHLEAVPKSTEAFPLTLTFESGKVITVAVPIITGEAE